MWRLPRPPSAATARAQSLHRGLLSRRPSTPTAATDSPASAKPDTPPSAECRWLVAPKPPDVPGISGLADGMGLQVELSAGHRCARRTVGRVRPRRGRLRRREPDGLSPARGALRPHGHPANPVHRLRIHRGDLGTAPAGACDRALEVQQPDLVVGCRAGAGLGYHDKLGRSGTVDGLRAWQHGVVADPLRRMGADFQDDGCSPRTTAQNHPISRRSGDSTNTPPRVFAE